MKKIFSMMLLMAVVMVGAFTSCKSDDGNDGPSAAKKIEGVYTAEMTYAHRDKAIGSKNVTVKVIASGANRVDIEIPEIKDLVFTTSLGEASVDINVREYGGYVIKDVPVISKDDVVVASKLTSASDFHYSDPESLFTEAPFRFKVEDVMYRMIVNKNQTASQTVVNGEVIAMKVGDKFSLVYSFYPAESLVAMGISVAGLLVK